MPMEMKLIHLLDRATDYWVLAFRVDPSRMPEVGRRAWHSGGYFGRPYVFFMPIKPTPEIEWNHQEWSYNTRQIAHAELIASWERYASGATVDVQKLRDEGSDGVGSVLGAGDDQG